MGTSSLSNASSLPESLVPLCHHPKQEGIFFKNLKNSSNKNPALLCSLILQHGQVSPGRASAQAPSRPEDVSGPAAQVRISSSEPGHRRGRSASSPVLVERTAPLPQGTLAPILLFIKSAFPECDWALRLMQAEQLSPFTSLEFCGVPLPQTLKG